MLDYIVTIVFAILILILIITLLNIFPKFILFIIITLFLIIFILNFLVLANYINRYSISKNIGERFKTYCTLEKYNIFDFEILFDKENLLLFVLYLILLILFWSNKIISDISSNSLNSEIKIIGFNKYYNKDIYKNFNYEYECIYAIMLFLAFSTIIYGFNLIYYNFLGLNKKENNVIESIKIITKLIKDNINETYLEYYTDDELEKEKKNSITSLEYFNNYIKYITLKSTDDKYKEINKLYTDNKDEFFLKSLITHKLFDFDNREKKTNLYNTYKNSTCIFNLLSGKDIDGMFPTDGDLILSPLYKDSHMSSINKENIKTKYKKFVETLKINYSNINSYEKINIFYYKLDLLFAKFSGVIFSLFALVFFIKTEFKQFIKNFFNITIDPLEYTIDKYNNILKMALIIILLLFVSILFNS